MRSVILSPTHGLKAAPHVLEVTMSAVESLLGAETFLFEVSGWDESDIFFVERSDLEWDNFAGRHIPLNRMLADGALVVLRVFQPIELRQTPPVPYKVEFHRLWSGGWSPISADSCLSPV